MVNLLGTKLDGAGELRTVDTRALLGHVERVGYRDLDPRRGRAVAQRFNAGLYILGDVVEAGRRLQITASVYDPLRGTSAIGDGSAEGSAEDVFDLVDQVASQLLVSMRVGPGARVARIAGVTTSSLEAYRAYLEGESAFRAGQFEPALEAFERAIDHDTLFALAYYRKSIAAEWLTNTWRRGEHRVAEEVYRSILGTYPDDVEAWSQLGEVLFHTNPLHGRPQSESRDAFRRVLSYEPDDGVSLIHLARTAAAEGQLDELDSLAVAFLRLAPGGDRELEMLSLQAFAHGDVQREASVVDRLARAGDVPLALATAGVFGWSNRQRRATPVTELMSHPTRSADVRAVGHLWLAYLKATMGKLDSARVELAMSETFDRPQALEYLAYLAALPFLPIGREETLRLRSAIERMDWSQIPTSGGNPSLYFNAHYNLRHMLHPYLVGALSVRLGDTTEALRRADELERTSAPQDAGSMAQDFAWSLRSRVAHAGGRTAEALELIQRTKLETMYQLTLGTPFAGQAFERFWRAEMLREAGQDREALQWYENSMPVSPYEVLFLPIKHLRRGEIHERLGEPEEALRHYSEALEFWRNADPEFQTIVNDVRTRIARLSGEPGAH
jgi:tetratricopeptide (TPR) repeat protein